MSGFFDFEADFVDSLRCIPMAVRLKLDTCGVKLKLVEWNHLAKAECDRLVELPCVNANEIAVYREYLTQTIVQQTGRAPSLLEIDPAPPWLNDREVSAGVKLKADEEGLDLTLLQWQQLTPLQRFALIKLTRSSHENNNFIPALKEFGLLV